MLAKSEIQKEALNLPARDRIELVVRPWDSLEPGNTPVPTGNRFTNARRSRTSRPRSVRCPGRPGRKRLFSDRP